MPESVYVERVRDELTDAIDYLRGRERAVQAQIATLNADLRKICNALIVLGAKSHLDVSDEGESETPDATPAPGTNAPLRYGRPVRAMVQGVLESENRPWTSAEVQQAIQAMVGPERVDAKLPATVRTALWTLRQKGRSVTDQSGRHFAMKWATKKKTPAGTEVSGTAPTSGPGGDDDQAQAQDHRHDLPGWNGVHRDRTPVGG